MTTVTDVMILNCIVGLDVARDGPGPGTQSNTQGVWPCKLQIDSLPLQLLAMSPESLEKTATSKLSNNSCRVVHGQKQITDECDGKKQITHEYNKFEMSKIIINDVPSRHRVFPQTLSKAHHQPVWESSDTVHLDH